MKREGNQAASLQVRVRAAERALSAFMTDTAGLLRRHQERIADLEEGLGQLLAVIVADPSLATSSMRKIVEGVIAEKRDQVDAMAEATRLHLPDGGTKFN